MTFIPWDNKFLTGNAEVDHQHQDLFALVNTLHEAIMAGNGKERLIPTLDKLAAYVVNHFRTEESLMQAKSYPGYPQHKAKHEDLTRQTAEIIDGFKSGKLVLTITLSRFLGDWLKIHIMEEDFKMATWVKAQH